MNETRKTAIFAGAAVVLALIAIFSAPKRVTPDAFFDQGEEFFPEFKDPNAARTLEVIDYDESTGSAVPFKVTFSDGRWTIPSHHGYPADGKDRLAQTAASVIGVTKDDFRTDNPADYAACGVIDPLDDTNPSLEGRGKRVTIKGENDKVLADLIIGKALEGRDDFYLVREPGKKRVYGAKMKVDISTKFSDWIEKDLLLLERDEIDVVTLRDYSIDERTGQLDERDTIVLTKDGENWDANDMKANQEVDRAKMSNLLRAVDELSIEGVRPKPAGLSATLSKVGEGTSITQGDMLSLQDKGFYFTRDGRLVSNEGELQVRTTDGVTYTMRFGEVVYGSGSEVSAGGASGAQGPGENRYLMITTSFDPKLFPEPPKPENTNFLSKPDSLWTEDDYRMKGIKTTYDDWNAKVTAGQSRSDELNDRFAGWYYVISQDSFEKLSLTRADLLREKQGS